MCKIVYNGPEYRDLYAELKGARIAREKGYYQEHDCATGKTELRFVPLMEPKPLQDWLLGKYGEKVKVVEH